MANNVQQGHRARKRFGQNFLNDDHVINQIVTAIDPHQGEVLVEIGPGLGAITEPVCERVDHLNVVELDRDLAERLRNHATIADKLSVHEADAMQFDFATLFEDGKKVKVFGNLPYNISTPLLFHLFTFCDVFETMHFMLQKEVVQRMAAGPGSKTYGKLSIMTQLYCQVIPVIEIGPEAFTPPPKVDSAVVRLVPRPYPKECKSIPTLNQVCAAAFNQRRKTLRNGLKEIISAEQLEALGVNPTIRPEQVHMDQFIDIANWVSEQ